MQENGELISQDSALEPQSQMHAAQVSSENLPKNVSMQLYSYMTKVTENNVTPETVKAACQCATEIHRMLKFNLDLKKTVKRAGDSTDVEMEDVINKHLYNTLKEHDWNRTHTANALGLSLKTVRNRIAILKSKGFEVNDKPSGR